MTKLNSHTCDCIVIGGGAAGMMSAVCASQGGASVILIEHTARLGSKILQTGNGKCNFTNCICRQTVIRTAILTLSCRF
mgnify:CR=1 FL=1